MDAFFIDGFRMAVIMMQIVVPIFFVMFSYPKRSHFALRSSLACLLSLLYAFFVHAPDVENKFPQLLISSLYFYLFFILANGIVFFCYKIKFRSSVVIAIVAYTLQHLCYLLFNLVDQILLDNCTLSGILQYVFVRRLSVTALLIPLSYLLGRKVKKNPNILLPSSVVFSIALIATLSDIVVSNAPVSEELTSPLSTNLSFYAIRLFNILVCTLILNLIFAKVEQSQIEREMELVKHLNEEKSRLYEINKETIDLINFKVHDFKHQIHALTNAGKAVSTEALEEINDTLCVYDTHVKTGREALDVILQEKGLLCNSKGIRLECMVDASGLSSVNDHDLYSLFGNILDNAIEACSPCEEREIFLKVKRVGGLTVISEENTYGQKIEFVDGFPKTTKEDDRYHGYGVKSIQYLAQKYRGSLKLSADERYFRLTVSLENRA